ncbi:MAG: BrnT family toxin [Oscillospiraceae bacterium]|nr:BrnT family toxin [Oscillospiraceae bacterium]
MIFEWDTEKNKENIEKHSISFEEAQLAFCDKGRFIEKDVKHSTLNETRYFLYGDTGKGIATVRFTIRNNIIRLIGAGYWRQGRDKYEKR